jgi:hypothetical protein
MVLLLALISNQIQFAGGGIVLETSYIAGNEQFSQAVLSEDKRGACSAESFSVKSIQFLGSSLVQKVYEISYPAHKLKRQIRLAPEMPVVSTGVKDKPWSKGVAPWRQSGPIALRVHAAWSPTHLLASTPIWTTPKRDKQDRLYSELVVAKEPTLGKPLFSGREILGQAVKVLPGRSPSEFTILSEQRRGHKLTLRAFLYRHGEIVRLANTGTANPYRRLTSQIQNARIPELTSMQFDEVNGRLLGFAKDGRQLLLYNLASKELVGLPSIPRFEVVTPLVAHGRIFGSAGSWLGPTEGRGYRELFEWVGRQWVSRGPFHALTKSASGNLVLLENLNTGRAALLRLP